MNQEPNTPNPTGGNTPPEHNHYYTAPDYGQPDPYIPPAQPSRAFSIASLVLGIFGLVCCCFGPAGLIFAVLSIVFAALARRRIGMFDGMATAGLILGIIGAVAGLYMTYSYVVVLSTPEFWEEFWLGYEEGLEEGLEASLRLLR